MGAVDHPGGPLIRHPRPVVAGFEDRLAGVRADADPHARAGRCVGGAVADEVGGDLPQARRVAEARRAARRTAAWTGRGDRASGIGHDGVRVDVGREPVGVLQVDEARPGPGAGDV